MPMAKPGLLVLSQYLNKLSILFTVAVGSVCENTRLTVQHAKHIIVKALVLEIRIKIGLPDKVNINKINFEVRKFVPIAIGIEFGFKRKAG